MPPRKKTRPKANGQAPGNTRERIIKRCIELFNREGLRNVPITRIAQKVNISPGNVTYHFPRKQELIVAALAVMKERLRLALEQQKDVRSALDSAHYLLHLYRTLWDFRFFFNALTHVLADAQLCTEYTEFRNWAMQTLEDNFKGLCEMGFFVSPASPNSFRLLAENMWGLWLHWLRLQQVRSPRAAKPDNIALYECALHDWSLCEPWMRHDLARDLLKAFHEQLKVSAGDVAGASGSAVEVINPLH